MGLSVAPKPMTVNKKRMLLNLWIIIAITSPRRSRLHANKLKPDKGKKGKFYELVML